MPVKSRKHKAIEARGKKASTLPPEPQPQAERKLEGIEEELYLGEYESREKLEQEVEFWDATTAGHYAWCPRFGQYSTLGLEPKGEALARDAGNALHAGLHTLYVSEDAELALHVMRQTFGEDRPLPAPNADFGHINVGFLEVVFKNYLTWRRKHDAFKPLIVYRDELDMTNVVAAVLQILPDERVILGESKLVMAFEIDSEVFIYAGKPDLPIEQGGGVQVFDHKATVSKLGEYWANKHRLSNQLRGYGAMLSDILSNVLKKLGHRRLAGCLINAISINENAIAEKTKSGKPSQWTRFSRFGPWNFSPGHFEEAIVNQWWWQHMRDHYAAFASKSKAIKQYGWGQHTGKMCQGCPYLKLCVDNPRNRRGVLVKEYVKRERKFLDL